ncbi:hypothetical protein BCR37DRAFT_384425 [Protomyces lactucae-debilis]|uniref:CHCH domain-containing protein n=1 Tax=Protomyces lactucae-debilis TaxID=2754530 RepID=A0A1Y2EST7_PROLT|nr:uncharacterized protein BCR37DRAFT_384425 [Protomyces lactucae-debilis]ORY74607.1 hypothetical protein BCR37DRAFT_384425 [Protomyces lactucae-debilis]
MPRQSRGRAAPSRHTPAPAPAQSRQASTSSRNAPATRQVPPPAVAAQQSSGPGMFGNMMSTAAGVGIGSTIGHGLSSMLFGGSSNQQQQPEAQPQQQGQQPMGYEQQGMSAYDQYNGQQQQQGISCEGDAKQFTQCLEQTQGDMSACSYYLEQLKQCQAMARHA